MILVARPDVTTDDHPSIAGDSVDCRPMRRPARSLAAVRWKARRWRPLRSIAAAIGVYNPPASHYLGYSLAEQMDDHNRNIGLSPRMDPRKTQEMHRVWRVMLMLVLVVGGSPDATSQPATAQAEQLFRDGKRLMADGNFAEACEAFDGSMRKDPAVSTLLNLADCREKNQQYASAWAYFLDAARQTNANAALEAMHVTAQRRADSLEAKLSYLIINVPDEARVEGLTITRNGVAVDTAEWNRDIPVDGGRYVIAGKAPAYEAWSTTLDVANAKDKQSVNVPRFRAAVATIEASTSRRPPARHSAGGSSRRAAAIALWGVGTVGITGGVALELLARGTYADARLDTSNDRRHELTSDANRQRHYGIAADVVGVISIGAGVYLWRSHRGPSARVTVAPRIDRDRATLVVFGRF